MNFKVFFFNVCIVIIILLSCRTLVKKVNAVNKKIEFQNKKSYSNYLNKKYNLNLKNVYYVDKISYNKFISTVVDNKIDYFYGVFSNDSTIYKKTKFLLENQSCSSRITKEMILISNSNTEKDELFKKNDFINLDTSQTLKLDKNKKTVVLIFSYKLGSLRNKDFDEIEEVINKKNEFDLVIISLDPVAYLE